MQKTKIDLYSPVFGLKNKFVRVIWGIVYLTIFRFTPTVFFTWRSIVMRLFNSDFRNARIYPTARVWLPSNLVVGEGSTVGPNVNLYNQGVIKVGERVIVSQDSTVCASSHNYNDPIHPLLLLDVTIEDDVWICAEAFIGPGVKVGEGAVIGARAVLMKDAEPWSVYAGNPAVKIKDRRRFRE